MRYILNIAFLAGSFLYCSCGSAHEPIKEQQNAAASSSPMSCRIEGRIISIAKPYDADTTSVCARFPCHAKVDVVAVLSRGSSVSFSLNPGDTIEMQFAFTLLNTSKVFPRMKAHYPGLQEGDLFIADTEQRMKTGGGEFVIYDYRKE